MKNKKILALIGLLLIIAVISIIYWLVPSNDSPRNQSQTSESKEHISNNNSIQQKNLVKEHIKIDKFNPNTVWKDKTINFNGKTLHYKFGEGNPEETALLPEDYLAKGEDDGIPYVTPITEEKLYEFLSDQDLPQVLDKCENYNRQEMARLNPNIPINQLPILLQPTDFDIENILIINKDTGRKEINQSIVNQMGEFFTLLNNPLAGSEFSDKCAGVAYKESIQRIQEKFSNFTKSYTNTGAGLPSSIWLK